MPIPLKSQFLNLRFSLLISSILIWKLSKINLQESNIIKSVKFMHLSNLFTIHIVLLHNTFLTDWFYWPSTRRFLTTIEIVPRVSLFPSRRNVQTIFTFSKNTYYTSIVGFTYIPFCIVHLIVISSPNPLAFLKLIIDIRFKVR